MALRQNAEHGLLIFEVSGSHTHTHTDAAHFAGILWTSDQLFAETFIRQHKTLKHPRPRLELTIPAGKRPQTYGLDHAANGTGRKYVHTCIKLHMFS
jgi:hypothetical protein